MIVMKFGGSSLKDAERIKHVCDLVELQIQDKPLLVFSAMGSTTDNLLQAGRDALTGVVAVDTLRTYHLNIADDLQVQVPEIEGLLQELSDLLKGIALIKELSLKTQDYLVSFGERLSVRIMSAYLNKRGIKAKFFDGWEAGIITNSDYSEADILPESYNNIQNRFADVQKSYDYTPVITGFIARDSHNSITTFGRGGSDLTASTIGAALEVREIQVWKDVDGILTTDPKIVSSAKPIPSISFEEASELAYFGAKVLHPLSIQPAMARSIPVRVKNSYNPQHPGTIIIGTQVAAENCVRAITCKRRVTVVDLISTRMLGQHGFLATVFKIFDRAGISVDMVATSEISVSVTLNARRDLSEIRGDLDEIAEVTVSHDKAIVSLIGDVKRSSEILDSVFSTLLKNGVNVQMISQGASKVNIGFIVEDSEAEKCINQLHSCFFD